MTTKVDGIIVREVAFSVPWGEIRGKSWNDPCLQPVLCVHGRQDNAGAFDRLIPLLPRQFHFLCIDLPGHGYSTSFANGVRLDFFFHLNAIDRVIRQLRWKTFCFIGHSIGGWLGAYLAGMYPEKIIKLVSLDSLALDCCPMGDHLTAYRKLNDALLRTEGRGSSSLPCSHEVALERLMKARPTPIGPEAAGALLERYKQKDGTYRFPSDRRLKLPADVPMTKEQALANLGKVRCPFLFVPTRLLYNFTMRGFRNDVDKSTLEVLMKNPLFEMHVVDGYHDVHNDEPFKVAPFISTFLIRQKSVL